MKFLLAAVNAKYIHSNLGIYSLKACADASGACGGVEVELAEYTINHQPDQVLRDIYRRRPDVVGFSCYIWNISFIRELLFDLAQILPGTDIWLGGPEVSFRCAALLEELPMVRGIMKGEGEETFPKLAAAYAQGPLGEGQRRENMAPPQSAALPRASAPPKSVSAGKTAGIPDSVLTGIPGLVFRRRDSDTSAAKIPRTPDFCAAPRPQQPGVCDTPRPQQPGVCDTPRPQPPGICGTSVPMPPVICDTPEPMPADMSAFPFAYTALPATQLEHRIIYYESSRGCPFSCSYCLSSVDKALRFKPVDQVCRELDFFLERRVPQVKFVDRTFNCKRDHAIAIWRHILEHDNGVTNFHFEIAADLLDEDQLKILSRMRPGLIQLEIGVQSTNPETLREIRRKTDIDRIRRITGTINGWHNIHQHLDLIAGLPFEDLSSFRRSFDDVYRMEPEQLQLGFLKVLKGSHMADMAETYGLAYSAKPPYEVLFTRWISYGDLMELKGVEEMLEVHYNSRQFVHTLELFQREFSTPYDLFLHMARYYESRNITGINHSRLARYEIFWDMICDLVPEGERRENYRDALLCDLYLRENAKSRPVFARDQTPFKERIREFFRGEEAHPVYLTGYEGCDARQLARMAHVEGLGDGTMVLFDYRRRDPLSNNARAYRLR